MEVLSIWCPSQEYKSGRMLTGELKNELIGVLQKLVSDHQERRKIITEDVVRQYMTPRPLNFKMDRTHEN